MKVLITGSREWKDRQAIFRVLYGFPKDTIIINGDCRGADKLSTEVAQELGFDVHSYPADWDNLGKAAGPLRNRAMLLQEEPDLVIAFHSNIKESKGTKDMCQYAKSQGVPVVLVIK